MKMFEQEQTEFTEHCLKFLFSLLTPVERLFYDKADLGFDLVPGRKFCP